MQNEPEALLECEELLKTECARYGPLIKVTVFAVHSFSHGKTSPGTEMLVMVQTNPEGVALVKYASPAEADDALTMLDYRVLRKRQVRAKTWDGKVAPSSW